MGFILPLEPHRPAEGGKRATLSYGTTHEQGRSSSGSGVNTAEFASAIQDFHRARRRGALRSLLARLAGRSQRTLALRGGAAGLTGHGRGAARPPANPFGPRRRLRRALPRLHPRFFALRRLRRTALGAGPGGGHRPRRAAPPIEVYKVGGRLLRQRRQPPRFRCQALGRAPPPKPT